MSFDKRTPKFGIPLHGEGKPIRGNELKEIFTIIENQLIAGMKGLSTCVFEEGVFDVQVIDANTRKIVLNKPATEFSLSGIVDGKYIATSQSLEWDNLSTGSIHYLYVNSSQIYADPSNFTTSVTTTKKDKSIKTFLLMGEFDFTGTPVFTPNPIGKLYVRDLADHVDKIVNPHGSNIEQDYLQINNELTATVSGDEISISTIVHSLKDFSPSSNGTQYFDILSSGTTGTVVSVTGASEIVHVNAHQNNEYGEQGLFDAGLIMIGYYGTDTTVDNENEIKVYNKGLTNIKIKVQVIYN